MLFTVIISIILEIIWWHKHLEKSQQSVVVNPSKLLKIILRYKNIKHTLINTKKILLRQS